CGTLPHDFLEAMQLPGLLLVRIEAFPLQSGLELRDLVVRKVVLNRTADLGRHQRQKANFLLAIGILGHAADEQRPQFVPRTTERNGTYGLNLFRQALQDVTLPARLAVERSNHQRLVLLVDPSRQQLSGRACSASALDSRTGNGSMPFHYARRIVAP